MDIRQIRYFVYAVEGTSLSAAAKRQYVTVQAVSKAISELESELGSRLLIRGNHGVQPTAIGLAFYERARKMLESFNELEDFTKSFPVAKDSGRMIIALCSPAFANAEQFMTTLSKYIGARLGIKLDIIITPGKLAIDALMAGDIDAACTIGEYTSPDTDSVTIGSLPTGIALAKSHPLAHQQSVTLADLRPYPVTWSETYDLFNRSIQAARWRTGMVSPLNSTRRTQGSSTPSRACRLVTRQSAATAQVRVVTPCSRSAATSAAGSLNRRRGRITSVAPVARAP